MAAGSAWGWAAGGAAVIGLIWLASGKKSASSSVRSGDALAPSPIALPSQLTPLEYYTQTVKLTGVPLGKGETSNQKFKVYNMGMAGWHSPLEPYELAYVKTHYPVVPDIVQFRWQAQQKLFEQRFKAGLAAHPDDFHPAPDQYSKRFSLVFRPEHAMASMTTVQVPVAPGNDKIISRDTPYVPWGWFLTDEYGRPYEGWGAGGIDILTVISMVGNTVLPYIPGYGQAANAALQATIAIGQGKSLKEIGLAAARAALPPGAAYAFDLGVGLVIEGKAPDKALVDAAVTELDKHYPGAKSAYEQGQAMAKQYTGQNIPGVSGLTFGGVFT